MTFRQMHEAAEAQVDKGLNTDAAARPFAGKKVELDVIAGEAQSGICSMCFEVQFEEIKLLVLPHRDLDPIKFGIFVEQNAGKKIHITGEVAGGSAGFVKRSPLAVKVATYGP